MNRLRVPVTQHDHVIGPETAAVTLVEYGDYECPHCRLAHPVVRLLLARFSRQLRFAFRHFPLNQIHPNAETAAEAAEYAGAYDRFWDMHDGIYENQDRLSMPLLFALASVLGLSESGLKQVLIRGDFKPKIHSDFMGGVRSGVNGTPTFFINGERHDGTYAFEDLSAAISARLPAKAEL